MIRWLVLIAACAGTAVVALGADAGLTDGSGESAPTTLFCAVIDLCFSPAHDCDDVVIGVIDGAAVKLDLAIYSLNREKIVDAILAAKKRGVVVRVLVDRSESANAKEITQLKRLQTAGIPMQRNSHVGIMHMKVAIADGHTVATGSFNWTDPAVNVNDENVLRLECLEIARRYQQAFDARWNDGKGFRPLTVK